MREIAAVVLKVRVIQKEAVDGVGDDGESEDP